jgi:hypothetical protein
MKGVIRDRRLTPEEAAKYKAIREQVQAELPYLIARHHQRMANPPTNTDVPGHETKGRDKIL